MLPRISTLMALAILLAGPFAEPARPEVTGPFRLALIRVNYSDTTPTYTNLQLSAAGREMERYFGELSKYKLRLEIQVADIGMFGRSKNWYFASCDPALDPSCPHPL